MWVPNAIVAISGRNPGVNNGFAPVDSRVHSSAAGKSYLGGEMCQTLLMFSPIIVSQSDESLFCFNNRVPFAYPICTSPIFLREQAVVAFTTPSFARHAATSGLKATESSNIPGPPYSGPSVKPILDSIESPDDMKRLDMRQLKQVRSETKGVDSCCSCYFR